jgi:hypothetical protein
MQPSFGAHALAPGLTRDRRHGGRRLVSIDAREGHSSTSLAICGWAQLIAGFKRRSDNVGKFANRRPNQQEAPALSDFSDHNFVEPAAVSIGSLRALQGQPTV